ncbi:hypothetical protein RhiirB3_419785 [Rhizophagus irregularis]|nr:hypothetical protein RhiirB3_419785 [Rhizophagus irregularis]
MLASEDAHIAVCKGAGETKQVVYFIPLAWTGHYAIKVGYFRLRLRICKETSSKLQLIPSFHSRI